VSLLSPQRRSLDRMPGGVYDCSVWLTVCVTHSLEIGIFTWMPVSLRSLASSSLQVSHSLSDCVACDVVLGLYWSPRWTRASRLGGVTPIDEKSAGGFQKGGVSLLIRISSLGALLVAGSIGVETVKKG